MMGKSRLLKQIANYTPLVYICLRPSTSTGYPKRSPIAAWLLQRIQDCLKPKPMLRDDSNFLATLQFAAFFEATLDQLVKSINPGDPGVTGRNFSWLWEFFAEPKHPSILEAFWRSVIENAQEILSEKSLNKEHSSYGKTICEVLLTY